MERYRRLLIILFAVAVTIPAAVKSRRSHDVMAPAAFSVRSSPQSFVRISGDVRHPGMYALGVNNLASDVISMAIPVRPISVLEPADAGTVPLKNGESLQLRVRSNGSGLVTRGAVPVAERLVMGIPWTLTL